MDCGDLLRRLEGIGPAPVVEATALMLKVHRSRPDSGELVALQPRIDAAVREIKGQVYQTERLRRRCREIRGQPGRSVPTGF